MLEIAVTIVITTRNRAESLRKTLASIGTCQIPPNTKVELLVVDNGSIDHTKQVVEDAHLSNIVVRYLLEPKQGQCFARNAGLAAACGKVLLFTDDDVRVPENWVSEMSRPLLNGSADAIAGGVRFDSYYEERIQASGYSSLRSWFASTEAISEKSPDRFVGANMAFGRWVLKDVPAFDTHLGPGALGFGDETLFAQQIIRSGYRLMSAFECAVEHHFDLARMARSSMLKVARSMGASHAYVTYHWEHRLGRRTIVYVLRLRASLWMRRLCKPWILVGKKAELWELGLVGEIGSARQFLIESKHPYRFGTRAPFFPSDK